MRHTQKKQTDFKPLTASALQTIGKDKNDLTLFPIVNEIPNILQQKNAFFQNGFSYATAASNNNKGDSEEKIYELKNPYKAGDDSGFFGERGNPLGKPVTIKGVKTSPVSFYVIESVLDKSGNPINTDLKGNIATLGRGGFINLPQDAKPEPIGQGRYVYKTDEKTYVVYKKPFNTYIYLNDGTQKETYYDPIDNRSEILHEFGPDHVPDDLKPIRISPPKIPTGSFKVEFDRTLKPIVFEGRQTSLPRYFIYQNIKAGLINKNEAELTLAILNGEKELDARLYSVAKPVLDLINKNILEYELTQIADAVKKEKDMETLQTDYTQ